MEHSKNFYTYKEYYDNGFWSKKKLYNTVGKRNGIYDWEYEEITGEPYEV